MSFQIKSPKRSLSDFLYELLMDLLNFYLFIPNVK